MLDVFTTAYLEAALWSSLDDNEEPLDKNYGVENFTPEALEALKSDCEDFQLNNAEDIASDLSQAGHDFWLTRNRHGAGFWDGDWAKDAGERLTKASHSYGELNIIVGDDGLLHI